MSERKPFRQVNPALDFKPRFGPIPASQLLPVVAILFIAYLAKGFFELTFLDTALLCIWLGGSCWVLTGDRPWRLLIKFWHSPDLVRGFIWYTPLLANEKQARQQKYRHRRKKSR